MLKIPLTPISSAVRSYDFIALDCEGSGSRGGFVLATTYDRTGPRVFRSAGALARWLFAAPNLGKRIVTANLEYDYATAFQPFDPAFNVLLVNGRWLRASYHDGSRHSWTAWDIQNIAPLSVAEMGTLVGLEKYPTPRGLGVPVDPDRVDFVCKDHRRTNCIECYCSRDAEIVYRFAVLFQETLNALGGELKMTAAACSMDLWRRRYLDVEIAPTFPDKNKDHRRSYHGGRVENYRAGTAFSINAYDVNSLYPAIMRDLEVGLPDYYYHLNRTERLAERLDRFGMWEGSITVPRSYLPILPVHHAGRVFYPTGTITGAWPNSEIRFALDHGARIVSTTGITYAKRTVQPFTRFVDDLYTLRVQYGRDHDPRAHVVKVLLNALYGKFGQNVDTGLQSLIIPRSGYHLRDFRGCYPADLAGREVFLKPIEPAVQSAHIHVLWAAEITARARLRLYDLMQQVEGDLFYGDTDCVHTTATLPTGAGLGELKLAHRFERVTYWAPKEYAGITSGGDFEARAKGIPRSRAGEYLQNGLVEFSKPNRTLEAIATHGRIAQWNKVTRRRQFNLSTRDHLPIADYNRGLEDTAPFPVDALPSLF